MNKKIYMSEISKILRNTNLEEQKMKELLYQARDVVEQFDEVDIIPKLGTPQEYVLELFEVNDLDYVPKSKKKYEGMKSISFLVMIIGLLLIVCSCYMFISWGESHYSSYTLKWIIGITMLTILMFEIKNKKMSLATLGMSAIIVSLIVIMNPTAYIMTGVAAALMFLAGVSIFLAPSRKRKKYYSELITNNVDFLHNGTYQDDKTISVDMHFGEKSIKVSESIENVVVNMSFGSVKIDATDIISDLHIDVNGKFGDISIDLPYDAKIIDSTSVMFGGHNKEKNHINGDGVVVYIKGGYKFGSISY